MTTRSATGLPGVSVLALIAVGIVALAAWGAATYNDLVQSRLAVDAQWGQVEIQYQRRVDLIPELIGAVRGFLVQERTVIDAVAQARTAYLATPPGSPDRVRAAAGLQQPLGRLLAVVEASPTLRSSETVARLIDELTGTENRIAVERRRYNDRVQVYNTLVLQFPGSIVAGATGFRPRPYFEVAPPAAAPPAVTLPSR